jgi:sucrose-6-phosphate hydrolase SacC (GH32 family)
MWGNYINQIKKCQVYVNNIHGKISPNNEHAFMYLQTIPRAIQLHKSGKQLVQWPIVEVEKLRANNVNWPTKILNGGGELLKINGVTAAQVNYVLLIITNIIKLFIRTELKLILN